VPRPPLLASRPWQFRFEFARATRYGIAVKANSLPNRLGAVIRLIGQIVLDAPLKLEQL